MLLWLLLLWLSLVLMVLLVLLLSFCCVGVVVATVVDIVGVGVVGVVVVGVTHDVAADMCVVVYCTFAVIVVVVGWLCFCVVAAGGVADVIGVVVVVDVVLRC